MELEKKESENRSAIDIGLSFVPKENVKSKIETDTGATRVFEKAIGDLRIDVDRLFSDIQALEGMNKVQRNLLRVCEDEIAQLKLDMISTKNKHQKMWEDFACALFGSVLTFGIYVFYGRRTN